MQLMTNLILIIHLQNCGNFIKWSQKITEWMCEAKIV